MVIPSLRRAERTVAIVALGANLAQRLLPVSGRFTANLAAAAASTASARTAGVGWSELGLDRASLGAGFRWGVGAGAVLAAGVVVAARAPGTRDRFVDERIGGHHPRRAAFELAARIPLETALAEELIFRGALLGIALRRRSVPAAVLSSSLLFGLWHVLPTWAGLGAAADPEVSERAAARLGSVAGVVAATTSAGAVFAVIRLRSGSVLAPVIAHAALNTTSFVVTRRRHERLRAGDLSGGRAPG